MNSTPANQSQTSQQSETYNLPASPPPAGRAGAGRQPTTNNPTSPPFPNSTLPFIVAGIITVSLVGIGAYFLGKSQNNPTTTLASPSPTSPTSPLPSEALTKENSPTTDPTANWKTYTNKAYGYSIKYPNLLSYLPVPPADSPGEEYYQAADSISFNGWTLSPEVSGQFIVRIDVDRSLDCSGDDACLLKWVAVLKKAGFIKSEDEIIYKNSIILGRNVRGIELKKANTTDQRAKEEWFLLKERQNIFKFQLILAKTLNSQEIIEATKIFDQILSTFKFL